MLTIGFISKIDKDTIFVTRNHIERDTPFPRENGVTFHIGDIVAINTFDSIVEGFRVSHIESIKLLNNIPINEIKIELEYSYQQLLINIATNNFCNEFFYDKLRDDKISKILLTDFLQDIICDNIQPVANYVQSTDIKNIAKNRRISIDEILDKNGDYKRDKVYCTDYNDNYPNGLLYFYGYYSPWCVNISPCKKNNETYSQAVSRVERETLLNALTSYSHTNHLTILMTECQKIRKAYKIAKAETFTQAKEYMNFPLSSQT